MNPLLSPKELAQAIGVSESSLKRWADDGRIRVSRTAGGHRRIPIAEAIRFIRDTKAPVVRPDVLGLPDLVSVNSDPNATGDDNERLFQYLHDGDGPAARGLILSLYLSGQSIAALSDGPISHAMGRIGDLWQEDDAGIFYEHRASAICIEAVHALQSLLPHVEDGPTAVGGAPREDHSALPSILVSAVLQAEGFRAVNLGPHTPIPTLALAGRQHDAALVWLSVTHAPALAELADSLLSLSEALDAQGAQLLVGGYDAKNVPLPARDNVHLGQSMSELVAFARGLRRGHGRRQVG